MRKMVGHAPVLYRKLPTARDSGRFQEVYHGKLNRKHGIHRIVTVNVIAASDFSNKLIQINDELP